MEKIPLAAQATQHGPGHDPRTDHLRPVLAYLLAQGNRPAQWWQENGWRSDPGGELHYLFTDPIDAAQLREHFVFSDSIRVYEDGSIRDSLNRVDICHNQLTPSLSFELTAEYTLLAADTTLSTDPPAVDDEKADELLRQLITAGNARRDAGPA